MKKFHALSNSGGEQIKIEYYSIDMMSNNIGDHRVLSVQGKEEASLPKKFLFELYEEGYTLVQKNTATDPVFQYVSWQLVRCGVVFSEDELKEAVVNYQRDNKEMLVNNYGNLLKMYVHVGMKDDLPSAFDVHVSELENNQRLANGFDINCLALFLDCEIVVYFPNESDELGLCRYNCNGKKLKRHIAMVFNGHRFPYHVFSTNLVHKKDRFNNPYAEFMPSNE